MGYTTRKLASRLRMKKPQPHSARSMRSYTLSGVSKATPPCTTRPSIITVSSHKTTTIITRDKQTKNEEKWKYARKTHTHTHTYDHSFVVPYHRQLTNTARCVLYDNTSQEKEEEAGNKQYLRLSFVPLSLPSFLPSTFPFTLRQLHALHPPKHVTTLSIVSRLLLWVTNNCTGRRQDTRDTHIRKHAQQSESSMYACIYPSSPAICPARRILYSSTVRSANVAQSFPTNHNTWQFFLRREKKTQKKATFLSYGRTQRRLTATGSSVFRWHQQRKTKHLLLSLRVGVEGGG